MKPFIIAVAGQYANGKDAVANYLDSKLTELYPAVCWHREAFANHVKRIFCETFGVNRDFVETWKRKDEIPPDFNIPMRQGLTFIGDGFRNIQPNIWIDLLFKNNNKNLILSDCRYCNEFKYIHANNGIMILLWRPGHENQYQNRSEQELMPFVEMCKKYEDGYIREPEVPFDVWIRNDGTISDLYDKIDSIVIPLVAKKYEC